MNFTHRLIITLFMLSLHHINFSMSEISSHKEDFVKNTLSTYGNCLITIHPPFNPVQSPDVKNLFGLFLKSLLIPSNQTMLYHPLLIITPIKECQKGILINRVYDYKQYEIHYENRLAIMHSVPQLITPTITTVNTIIELIKYSQKNKLKAVSVQITPNQLPIVSQPTPLRPDPLVNLAALRTTLIARTPHQILSTPIRTFQTPLSRFGNTTKKIEPLQNKTQS